MNKVHNNQKDKNMYLEAWKLRWFFSMFAWMISSSSRLCKLPDRFFVCLRSRCSLRWWRWGRVFCGGGRWGLLSPEHDDLDEASSSCDSLSLCSSSLCSAQSGGAAGAVVGSLRRRRRPSRLSRWLRAFPSSGATVSRTCMVFDP